MDTREALTALGVTEQTLSQAEKEHLDQKGYLPLANILPAELIARMNHRLDELIALEGEDAGKEVHQEAGTMRLSDLVNKDPIFDICFTHPRLLAAIDHVLGGVEAVALHVAHGHDANIRFDKKAAQVGARPRATTDDPEGDPLAGGDVCAAGMSRRLCPRGERQISEAGCRQARADRTLYEPAS